VYDLLELDRVKPYLCETFGWYALIGLNDLSYKILAIGIILHLSNGFVFFSGGLSHY
jgi:hypothetical protein